MTGLIYVIIPWHLCKILEPFNMEWMRNRRMVRNASGCLKICLYEVIQVVGAIDQKPVPCPCEEIFHHRRMYLQMGK